MGGGPDYQVVSIKRTADGRRQRRGRSLMKKEKNMAKNGFLHNTSKGATFVILKNHTHGHLSERKD